MAALRRAFSSPISGGWALENNAPATERLKGTFPGDLLKGPSQGSQATWREGPAFSWVSPQTTCHCISPMLTTVLLLEVNTTVHGCGPSCQWPAPAPRGLLPEEHPGRHALLSLRLRALCSPGPKGKNTRFQENSINFPQAGPIRTLSS